MLRLSWTRIRSVSKQVWTASSHPLHHSVVRPFLAGRPLPPLPLPLRHSKELAACSLETGIGWVARACTRCRAARALVPRLHRQSSRRRTTESAYLWFLLQPEAAHGKRCIMQRPGTCGAGSRVPVGSFHLSFWTKAATTSSQLPSSSTSNACGLPTTSRLMSTIGTEGGIRPITDATGCTCKLEPITITRSALLWSASNKRSNVFGKPSPVQFATTVSFFQSES